MMHDASQKVACTVAKMTLLDTPAVLGLKDRAGQAVALSTLVIQIEPKFDWLVQL